MHPLTSISPIDGRYQTLTGELALYFSEAALMRYRLKIETEYLLALTREPQITEIKPLPAVKQKQLRSGYLDFSLADAQKIKIIEGKINHDVKAIEYFLQQKLTKLGLKAYQNFIHFALTSEDINNLAYSLMWQEATRQIYLPTLAKLTRQIVTLAQLYKKQPLLALTHGQSATPTTVGKELAVFAARLKRQTNQLKNQRLLGKLNGATGTWSAQLISYPEVNWLEFSQKFIRALDLEPNLLTTQIEPHDTLAESYHTIIRINTILLGFTRDLWLYISRGILAQKPKANEVGSSTMPHKINPINFENAEGNLGLANSWLEFFAQKLPISRMQRDLSDSTVRRNQGLALAYCLLAAKNISQGLARLTINKQKINQELAEHWEVLAEAVQTILRKTGHKNPYEKLKQLTRGHKITQPDWQKFITTLRIPQKDKDTLLALTPHTYTGLSAKIVACY